MCVKVIVHYISVFFETECSFTRQQLQYILANFFTKFSNGVCLLITQNSTVCKPTTDSLIEMKSLSSSDIPTSLQDVIA